MAWQAAIADLTFALSLPLSLLCVYINSCIVVGLHIACCISMSEVGWCLAVKSPGLCSTVSVAVCIEEGSVSQL